MTSSSLKDPTSEYCHFKEVPPREGGEAHEHVPEQHKDWLPTSMQSKWLSVHLSVHHEELGD